MQKFAIAYGASAAVFLVLDFIWLTLASRFLYRPQLGNLLSDNPNLVVAAAFYLVYVVGVVVFAVLPAHGDKSWLMALGFGALLGLVAYGTYDITNLATLRDWPVMVSVVDLAWGVFVTSAAALSGYLALSLLPDA